MSIWRTLSSRSVEGDRLTGVTPLVECQIFKRTPHLASVRKCDTYNSELANTSNSPSNGTQNPQFDIDLVGGYRCLAEAV